MPLQSESMFNDIHILVAASGKIHDNMPAGGKLRKAIEGSFGKYDTWLADFRAKLDDVRAQLARLA